MLFLCLNVWTADISLNVFCTKSTISKTFFFLTFSEVADKTRLTADEMDLRRQENIAYEYLCHLEEAKVWVIANHIWFLLTLWFDVLGPFFLVYQKSGHGYIIKSHNFMWMYLLIHALNSMPTKQFSVSLLKTDHWRKIAADIIDWFYFLFSN